MNQSEIDTVCQLWDMYKTDFIVFNKSDGILRASFLINYFLFKLEFAGVDAYNYVFNNKAQVNSAMQKIQNNLENNSKKLTPGFNYRGANTNLIRLRGIPNNATKARKFGAVMLIKKNIITKLFKNGSFVSVNSDEYREAEDEMVRLVDRKIETIPEIRTYREVFKYTGYGRDSKVMESFFFHSMVMFGWYAFFGIRNRTVPGGGRAPVATEFPGSCNVQACMNMYYFMKKGILSKLVYIPHGATHVSRAGQINVMTAQRARGMDDVQFCHHGFHLAGEVIGAHNQNTGTYASGQGYGNWYARTVYSHSDAFDVITLATIYRARARLHRAGKTAQFNACEKLIDGLNTKLKKFVRDHLLSNIPMNAQNIPTGKVTAGGATKPRTVNNQVVKNEIRSLPRTGNNLVPSQVNINRVIARYRNFFRNKNIKNFFLDTLHPNWRVKLNNVKENLLINGRAASASSSDPWERLLARI